VSSKNILITGAGSGFGKLTAQTRALKRPLRTAVDKIMGGTAEIINHTYSKVQPGSMQNLRLNQLNEN
jgi:NAD(P)-dependent dehydrogenase (short-subunit alcohol dehydrogenase family)